MKYLTFYHCTIAVCLSIFCFGQTTESNIIKYEIPPLVNQNNKAMIKSELIYSLENRPTPQAHASSLVETDSGLICAFFAGTYEMHPDVGIRVSRLQNNQWTWPEEVANGIINDTLRYPCWNPVLFQVKEGPLMLFYKVGPHPQEWWGMVITSYDNGKTWTEPRKLGYDEKIGHLLGPIKNKPIQLKDGTIICPTSIEYKTDSKEQDWRVYFEISKDMGSTWEIIGPINDGVEFDAIQPSILTYEDGRMQVICRTRQGVLSQSWSSDGGNRWSEMFSLNLPNPNSGTDAITLKDGRQLLVYNHTTRHGEQPKGRNMLNVALSSDGLDWIPVMTLENEPIKDGYAYPAVIQSSDGLVHITYTYNRRSIKYVVIDPDKI